MLLARGDVNGLSAYVSSHLNPAEGPILYLSGADTSADLAGKLKARGFSIHRIAIYDAVPAAPENLATEMTGAEGVLLYSPRTAQHWLSAINQLKAGDIAARLMHFCLSANVAAKLPGNYPRRIAESPDETGMLTMLDHQAEAE
jgi:uroporphyrinogen-III synthase